MRLALVVLTACGRLGFDEEIPDPVTPDTELRDDCDVEVELPSVQGATVEAVASNDRGIALVATRGAEVFVAMLAREAGVLRGIGTTRFELPARGLTSAVFAGDRLVVARGDRAVPNSDVAVVDTSLGVVSASYPAWGIDSLTALPTGVLGIGREPDGEMLARILDASGAIAVDEIRPDSGDSWGRTHAAPLGPDSMLVVHDHRGTPDEECDITMFAPIATALGFTVEDERCRAIDVAYNAAIDRQAVVYEGLDARVRFRPVRDLQPTAGPEVVLAEVGVEPAIAVDGDGFSVAYEAAPHALEVVALDGTGMPIAGATTATTDFDRWWLDDGAEARLSWAVGGVASTRRLCR